MIHISVDIIIKLIAMSMMSIENTILSSEMITITCYLTSSSSSSCWLTWLCCQLTSLSYHMAIVVVLTCWRSHDVNWHPYACSSHSHCVNRGKGFDKWQSLRQLVWSSCQFCRIICWTSFSCQLTIIMSIDITFMLIALILLS